MNSTNLIPGLFTLGGIVLLIMSYLIGVKKKTNLISGLDEKKLKKVKDIDKFTKDYSKALIIVACTFFIATILLLYLGNVGKVVGIIVILIACINLSKVTLNIETKEYNKKY